MYEELKAKEEKYMNAGREDLVINEFDDVNEDDTIPDDSATEKEGKQSAEYQYDELDYIPNHLTEEQQTALEAARLALKRAGISVNVVSDEQAEEVFNENNGEQTEFSIQSINDKFNKELQQQIDGTLPENHVYSLGMPSDVLLSAGLQNLPIELRSRKLEEKSKQENHVFSLKDVENLPNVIQNPIMVFDSSTKLGRKVILTELNSEGNNFVVAVGTIFTGNKIKVNTIRSIYPKDNTQGIIDWINRGDLLNYINKNKVIDWIGKQRSNSAEVTNTLSDLEIVAKVIQNFENPPINDEKLSTKQSELSTSGGLIYGYAQNGEIYLTERGLNPNTPVHEYTHLWAAAMMKKQICNF